MYSTSQIKRATSAAMFRSLRRAVKKRIGATKKSIFGPLLFVFVRDLNSLMLGF